MRRVFACLLLAIACTQTFAQARPGKTICFWAVTGSADDAAMYTKIGREFEAKTGIAVEVSPLAWGNFESKYFTSMAAGMPPDVGATNLGGPFNYGTVGGLADLRAEFPSEIQELEHRFNPATLPMFTVGKQLFGLPTDVGILVLAYRTDIFEKLSLKAPKTWSELNKAIAALEANHYRYYLNWTLGAQWSLDMFTKPFGVTGLDQDSTGKSTLHWNDPRYQKGVMQALDLWYMHDSPGRDLGSRAIGLFASDKTGEGVPLIIDLFNIVGQIELLAPQVNGKWTVAAWPKADDGKEYHVVGGLSYVLFRKSKHHREAFEWIKYLATREVQEQIFLDRYRRVAGPEFTIPAVTSFWSSSHQEFWENPELKPVIDLKSVVATVFPSLGTSSQVQGANDVQKLESNMLDGMKTVIDDLILATAQRHNLSRSNLLSAFGRGHFAQDREALYADVAATLKSRYQALIPQAQVLLDAADARSARLTKRLAGHLDEFERATSVLQVLERGLAALLLGLFALVAAKPPLRKHWRSYLYVATPLTLASVFVFLPALSALYISFTDYHPVLPLSTAQPVGIANYADSIHSGEIGSALGKTFYYVLGTLPLGIVLSLACALLLNSKPRFEQFWRFLFFSPLVTSAISIALIFSQLFLSSKDGWLNGTLLRLGLTSEPISFLTSEHTFLKCAMALAVWHGIAFSAVVFLAALQQIPVQLFEAAHLDGAPPITRLWKIVLPGIRPQMLFVGTLGVIGSFQVFETIFLLANKGGDAGARFGPNDAGMTAVPLIFHQGFESMQMGRSSANAYILFAIILALTLIQLKLFKPEGESA